MSKERLEEIKHFVDLIKYIPRNDRGMGEMDIINVQEDIEWLVGQAERVQELEERVFELKARLVIAHQYNDALKMIADDYEKQNKRYRKAIEVAINNMTDSDNLGVKYALGILEQALEGEE